MRKASNICVKGNCKKVKPTLFDLKSTTACLNYTATCHNCAWDSSKTVGVCHISGMCSI